MTDNDLSPQARQTRDEIVDLLIHGQRVLAIRRYMQASGKGLSEAKQVIDRLGQVLEKPGLNEAEAAFLAGFRSTLDGPRPETSDRPAPETSPTPIMGDVHPHALSVSQPPQSPSVRQAPGQGQDSARRPANEEQDRLPPIDWAHFLTDGGALLLLLAVFCIGASSYTLLHGLSQADWPSAPGTIIQARVAAPTTPGKSTTKVFAYEYQVNGKTYSADRYSFATVGGGRSIGIERFDPGDRVTVYYNPRNPSVASLERQRPGLFGVLVFAFGIAFLLASIGSLLARDPNALFTRTGTSLLRRSLISDRAPLARQPGQQKDDRSTPNPNIDPPTTSDVPWYAFLAAFSIGVLLVWLPGRAIHLFDRMGATHLSDVLGAGAAGIGLGGIGFVFAYIWPRRPRLWGVIISLPACAALLIWLTSSVLVSQPVSAGNISSVAITIVITMGLAVFGSHLGAARYHLQRRLRDIGDSAPAKVARTAATAPAPPRDSIPEARMPLHGGRAPGLGRAKKGKTTSNRLYGAIILLLVVAGLYHVGKHIVLASGQHDWVPAGAIVVESYSTETTKGSGFRVNRSHHFAYRYLVAGKQYTARRYSFWSLGGEPGTGVARYRTGDRLTIYHHPTWPGHAVVERISPSFFTWAAGLLLIMIAIPAGWMLWTGKANG